MNPDPTADDIPEAPAAPVVPPRIRGTESAGPPAGSATTPYRMDDGEDEDEDDAPSPRHIQLLILGVSIACVVGAIILLVLAPRNGGV